MSTINKPNNILIQNNSNHNNTKKKLSQWMKKIIQPTRESQITEKSTAQQHHSTNKTINRHATNDTLRLQWDQEPERQRKINKSITSVQNDTYSTTSAGSMESDVDSDHASIAPLFSFCSSSIKSSTFSDIHSMQSTRPTLQSARTAETNSSTIPIPPASILDRARATSNLTYSSAASITSSRPTSTRHISLQRQNSSRTVNSIITIKS